MHDFCKRHTTQHSDNNILNRNVTYKIITDFQYLSNRKFTGKGKNSVTPENCSFIVQYLEIVTPQLVTDFNSHQQNYKT